MFVTFWLGLFFSGGLVVGVLLLAFGGFFGGLFCRLWCFLLAPNMREPWSITWLPGTRIIHVVITPAAKIFLSYLHLFAFSFQSLILAMPFSDGLKSSLVLTVFSPGRCFYPVIKLQLNLFSLFFFFFSFVDYFGGFFFYHFSNFSIKKTPTNKTPKNPQPPPRQNCILLITYTQIVLLH